ncbi:MAG TPA: hypothetical protein VFT50_01480 [Baekduia sp.]|nr:hypothetical protein [Baekduia sp.]
MTPQRFVTAGLILLIGGCIVAAIATSTAGDAVGITLAGIGAVLLVAAAFLAIGLSEDRDRAKRPPLGR